LEKDKNVALIARTLGSSILHLKMATSTTPRCLEHTEILSINFKYFHSEKLKHHLDLLGNCKILVGCIIKTKTSFVFQKIEKYQLGASEKIMNIARKAYISIVGAGMVGPLCCKSFNGVLCINPVGYFGPRGQSSSRRKDLQH
jgi:hypothetical protein